LRFSGDSAVRVLSSWAVRSQIGLDGQVQELDRTSETVGLLSSLASHTRQKRGLFAARPKRGPDPENMFSVASFEW
jgi:hypothetical protein